MIRRGHFRLGSRKWNPTIYKGGTEYKAVNLYGYYDEYYDSGKPRIPSGYTLVPYIESNRNVIGNIAPYINTGLYADKTTRVICDLTFPSSNSIHPRFWSSGQIYTYCSSVSLEGTNQIRVKNFSGTSWPNASYNSNYNNVFANKRLLIDYDPYFGLRLEYDRLIHFNATSGDPRTSPGHIILNWASEATAGGDPDLVGTDMNGYGAFKHHEWQIYTGGELVSHLFPVVRDSDSEPGLYDTVRKIFLPSARGHFTAGTGEWTPHVRTKIGSYEFADDTSLTSYDIPKTVTSIGDYAFNNCRNLVSVNIPNSVTSIGNNSFMNCSSLSSITIPDSVTSWGTQTFIYCTNLNTVSIGNGLTGFTGRNFYSAKVKTLIIRGNSMNGPGTNEVSSKHIEKIYVPYSANHSVLNWYKAETNWSRFADIIFELNEDGSVPSE